MEVEFMKNAYGLLYRLENIVRNFIIDTMENNYGADWVIKAPMSMKYPPIRKSFSFFHYHELISLLSGYTCLKSLLNAQTIIELQTTIPIRNKIAHSHVITQEEYDKLLHTYDLLNYTISKQNIG